MISSALRENVILSTILLCSVANIILCLFVSSDRLVTYTQQHAAKKEYSYRGSDYPRRWPIAPLETVHMPLENTVHYNLDTPVGVAEWSSLVPANSGIIHLGPDRRPFSISLFHELRCLDVLRAELETQLELADQYVAGHAVEHDSVVHHCMNYVRQMSMCRGDTRLENVKRIFPHTGTTTSDITHTCKDWTAVFKAAEDNAHADVL